MDLKNIINEEVSNFLNERIQINNLPEDIVILEKTNEPPKTKFYLFFDTANEQPVGYIAVYYYDKLNTYSVLGAFVNEEYDEFGYGPFLYESAMTAVYPDGIIPSYDNMTSGDAQYVWDRFYKDRPDVKKEKIGRKTKIIYSYGKNLLNNLIERGNQYKIKNSITNDDINGMAMDIER